jgi:hypothetical protein
LISAFVFAMDIAFHINYFASAQNLRATAHARQGHSLSILLVLILLDIPGSLLCLHS